MSTHGRTGLTRVLLGSVAERVVQHSPCPVFVVRQSKRRKKTASSASINKILVPVDFSAASRAALKYAITFADRLHARLILFHASDVGYAYTPDGYAIYDIPQLQESALEAARKQMGKLTRTTKFGAVKFETAVRIGPPAWKICDAAEEHGADLIITGTHGRTGLQRVLMGSTAEQVVRHAPCSVLVAPTHAKMRVAHLSTRSRRKRSKSAKKK
jgi:nucleotide-binding universal stress UspA family protein